MAAHYIVVGSVLVHHAQEDALYARALLIDGVVKRIDKHVDALLNNAFVHQAGG